MAWRVVGSVTVRPTDDEVVIGMIEVPPTGGLEVRVRQTSPAQGFRFAYGLVSFVSPVGRELGKVKVWADAGWTDYRLGGDLTATSRWGNLTFEPRHYNLRWIKAGFPWTLEFAVDEFKDLPTDRHTTPGFEDISTRVLQLVRVGSQGRIRF